jgi:excinuclease ABC subunit C
LAYKNIGKRRDFFMANKNFSEKNVGNVKEGPGVYKLFNSRGSLTFVGKAKNIKERLQQHFKKQDITNIRRFDVKPTNNMREAEKVERNMIQRFKPHHNII